VSFPRIAALQARELVELKAWYVSRLEALVA
jgi:hypothetical protein